MRETNPAIFPAWLQRRREERDTRSPYGSYAGHAQGICGYAAGLCAECQADENRWLRQTFTTPALPGETPSQYAHRTGLPFVDGWYSLAALRIGELTKGESV